MTRCIVCHRYIWPWQSYGWRMGVPGGRWHASHIVVLRQAWRSRQTVTGYVNPDGSAEDNWYDVVQGMIDEAQQ